MKNGITSYAVQDHNRNPYQVAAFISGTSKEEVLNQLEEMIKEIKAHSGDDGRPIQGTVLGGSYIREIKRPRWGKIIDE